MSRPEILEKSSMNMPELKSNLEKIKKRDGELSFRGERTMEYLNEYTALKKKPADEMIKKLEGLKIARLKEEFIHKIADTLPRSVDELKVFLQGYTLTLSKDDMTKVMKVVKEFVPKKK